MCPSDAPTRQDLDRLLERLGLGIEDILQLWEIDKAEAEALVQEALVALSYRWGRIHDRERWLIEAIEKKARSCSKIYREETEDE